MNRTALNEAAVAREIGAAMETPSGRAVIGQTILEPFKRGRDYVAIGRQLMFVDHIPTGKMQEIARSAGIKSDHLLETPKADNTHPESGSENLSDITMGNQQERLEKVECELCHNQYQLITGWHLSFRHNMTMAKYKMLYPNSPTQGALFLRNLKKGAQGSGTKSTQTKLRKYGTTMPNPENWHLFKKDGWNPQKDEKVTERSQVTFKKTMLDKYGVDNPSKLKEFRDKRKATIWTRYGVTEAMLDPEIKRRSRTQRARGKMSSMEAELFKMFPLAVKYVGDSSHWFEIDEKMVNPDFLVLPFEETKKVIEVYGDYWHYKDNPQDRVDLFAKIGIKCLVIWGSELDSKAHRAATKVKVQLFLESSETLRQTSPQGVEDKVHPVAKVTG